MARCGSEKTRESVEGYSRGDLRRVAAVQHWSEKIAVELGLGIAPQPKMSSPLMERAGQEEIRT